MKDANGRTLALCFGHEKFNPDVCKHPLAAQFCSTWYEPKLMYGAKLATPDQVPTPESRWAPSGKRGKAGEFWWTLCCMHQIRCWACGTILHDNQVYQMHIQEKPPEVLAAILPRTSLEDARLISWHPSAARYRNQGVGEIEEQ